MSRNRRAVNWDILCNPYLMRRIRRSWEKGLLIGTDSRFLSQGGEGRSRAGSGGPVGLPVFQPEIKEIP